MLFHNHNVYTFDRMMTMLNSTNARTKCFSTMSQDFYDFDNYFDLICKQPISGTIKRTHIFPTMSEKLGIIQTQDTVSSPLSK